MIPSDSTLDPYFALAEELDLPVGVHTGKGTIKILSAEDKKKFRVEYGNPKWINDVLARHPRCLVARSSTEHAAWSGRIILVRLFPGTVDGAPKSNLLP